MATKQIIGLILLAPLVLVVLAAIAYSIYNDWTAPDAFFFLVVAMSCIGLSLLTGLV